MKNSKKFLMTSGRVIFLLFVCSAFLSQMANAQKKAKSIDGYLNQLPSGLELIENGPQHYQITTDYFTKDIYGNFINKVRVTGDYTRGLENDKVSWHDVRITTPVASEKKSFPEGELFNPMENFTYVPSAEMVNPDAFPGFPPNSFYAKNLVWDMLGLEGFAWYYFDSLHLNIPFAANAFNSDVDLAGEGTFTNKNIKLTWTGISRVNGEICAVIEYLAMDNPLKIKTDVMEMNGRSHYWGTIWVSLEDKQIELARLNEDVIMDMKLPNMPEKQLMNTTRDIVIQKVNTEL